MSVFLCYSTEDRESVLRLARVLTARQVPYWLDTGEIRAGESLEEKIQAGITGSKYLVIFISERSHLSDWVRRELDWAVAIERKRPDFRIVPVLLDLLPLPPSLSGRRTVDFSRPEHYQSNLDEFLTAIGAELFIIPKRTNLSQFEYLDVLHLDDRVIALLAGPSADGDPPFRNPDGTPYPLLDLYLVDAIVGTADIRAVRVCSARVRDGVVASFGDELRVFVNHKVTNGTYLMHGTMHRLRMRDLRVFHSSPIFEDKNWGHFPRIDANGDLWHFSYDGYFQIWNRTVQEPQTGSEAFALQQRYLSEHSHGWFPNSSDTLAKRLIGLLEDSGREIPLVGLATKHYTKAFISHCEADTPVAECLFNGFSRLKGEGLPIEVFLAKGVPYRTNWFEAIRQALADPQTVVFGLFSQASLNSARVLIETGYAAISGLRLVPLLLPDIEAGSLPSPYFHYKALNLRDNDVTQKLLSIFGGLIPQMTDQSRFALAISDFQRSIDRLFAVFPTRKRIRKPICIWLLGSNRELSDDPKQSASRALQLIGQALAIREFRLIVSGNPLLVEAIRTKRESADSAEDSYRTELVELGHAHAMLGDSATVNPIIIMGNLYKQQGLRYTFMQAVGVIPDLAILVGGHPLGRSIEEIELAAAAGIPVLPIRSSGGAAAAIQLRFDSQFVQRIDELDTLFGQNERWVHALRRLIFEIAGSGVQPSSLDLNSSG